MKHYEPSVMDHFAIMAFEEERSKIQEANGEAPNQQEKANQTPKDFPIYIADPRQWYNLPIMCFLVIFTLAIIILVLLLFMNGPKENIAKSLKDGVAGAKHP